jgi:hypothetical protein
VTVSPAVWLTPPCVAVIVTDDWEATFLCVTVNVPVSFPAGTTTEAGTLAAELFELFSVIVKPPVGAGLLIATVPITFVLELPCTELGTTVKDTKEGAWIVIDAFCTLVPMATVIFTVVVTGTAAVLMVNVAPDPPAATVTEEGTTAFVDEAVILTVTGFLPTVAFRVRLPVAVIPPTRLLCATDRLDTCIGSTDRTADWLTPP